MQDMPNVVVVLARCGRYRRSFGIRLEEMAPGQWVADWAFAIAEASARREKYDRSEIRGSMGFAQGYPGCPYCHAVGAVRCGCGTVACWDGVSQPFTCPGCGNRGEVRGPIESLTVGGDR